ncbi:malonyl-ACP O-methyltransferase BioC [Thiohalomonas denitrificans]|uniref:Malonyl-[acyl-carrier protein] O-methyltransferase n=1 Tax=Thiohalomonas denitrificans TaxID=415747 RepID=A0A1G5PUW7_9GAMM|nr:malonyl-ACP O-methyltransferase BioC [Thiohalomonas denitrificans]SCZ53323.1 malonyl-CoA O-methyltransferase [Thiohalomonas denitrificans]
MPDLPRPDKARIRESFERAVDSYDAAAVLQREVGERLLERLDPIRMEPQRILDVGAGTGWCSEALAQRYRKAQIVAMDLAHGMVCRTRGRFGPLNRRLRGHRFACGDAEQLPFADARFDLVFSNLTLQWCDLERTFAEFRRVLRPGGLVMFSTFGPDTLKELRASWAEVDREVHVNEFLDMHHVGDAMVNARLADPVVDMELLTLTYESVPALMSDLKSLGAQTVRGGRRPTLTGKSRLKALSEAYERFRHEGRLHSTWEVVYGHAWAPDSVPQQHTSDGATGIRFEQLRGALKKR